MESNDFTRFWVHVAGLINSSIGRHIVGWDPAPTPAEFAANDHTS
eukprot:gene14477-6297_t